MLTGATEGGGFAVVAADTATPEGVPTLLETPPPVLLSSLTSICREPSSVPLSSWIADWASSCSISAFDGVEWDGMGWDDMRWDDMISKNRMGRGGTGWYRMG